MKKSNSQIFWQLFGEFLIPIFFAALFIFLLTSCSGSRATQGATPAQAEEQGSFLTQETLPQFGRGEFFATLSTNLVLTKVATGGVDSLLVLADSTIRCVPGKFEGVATKVAVFADPTQKTSSFTYGQDLTGRYVILGKPGATKAALPTLFYGGEEYNLISGGDGILITPRGSTKVLPGWKPDPPKKN